MSIYSSMKSNAKPGRHINLFVPAFNFLFKIDWTKIRNFYSLERIIKLDVTFCVFCQNIAFITKYSILTDCCSPFNFHKCLPCISLI